MIKFDLVPADYRLRRTLSAWLRRIGKILAGATLVATASGLALAYTNKNLDSQIQELQTQHAITTQQRSRMEALDLRIGELGRQWQLLTTLRSGAPAEQIFTILDAALGGTQIWFHRWAFVRDGGTRNSGPETVNTGYFIVIPDGQDATPPPAWEIETHIKIYGQALDHSALSRFVRSLFERNEVRDVRVQNSTLHRYMTANVVDFELAVVLSGEGFDK